MSEAMEHESFFGDDINFDDIPDDPNALPDNTYLFEVTEANWAETRAGGRWGILFKYQIVEGSYSHFYPIGDWVETPNPKMTLEEKKRALAYLKQRLLAFGFKEEEIRTITPKNLEPTLRKRFFGTTKTKKKKPSDEFAQTKITKFDTVDSHKGDDSGDYSDWGV